MNSEIDIATPNELQIVRAREYCKAWHVDWFTEEQFRVFALKFGREY